MSKHRICLAPMLRYTDRYFHFLIRLMSRYTFLYTPIITTNTILHTDYNKILTFEKHEHPIAIQLGGCDPNDFAKVAQLIHPFGYDEINLNIGCPSDHAQAGKFGACLMANPTLVAECVSALSENTKTPITIKTRLGLEKNNTYDSLLSFVDQTSGAGCRCFIIHARQAWLDGLNPAQNRFLPPLCYEMVYRLKKDFPHLEIIINGGIKTEQEIRAHLNFVDGVMLGRKAYSDPYFFANIDSLFFGDTTSILTRCDIIKQYLDYAIKNENIAKAQLLSPILRMLHGFKNAKAIRRKIAGSISFEDIKDYICYSI